MLFLLIMLFTCFFLDHESQPSPKTNVDDVQNDDTNTDDESMKEGQDESGSLSMHLYSPPPYNSP